MPNVDKDHNKRVFVTGFPRASGDQKRRIAQVNAARSGNRQAAWRGSDAEIAPQYPVVTRSAAEAESSGLSPEGGVLLAGIFLSRRIAVPPFYSLHFSRTFRSSL